MRALNECLTYHYLCSLIQSLSHISNIYIYVQRQYVHMRINRKMPVVTIILVADSNAVVNLLIGGKEILDSLVPKL